jgi:hypothetical protein
VDFPSVPQRLIGPSYATLRVQLSAPGVVYYLATSQDDRGAIADVADDGPHVIIPNSTTNERRAAPTPEEVRIGVLAFLGDADASDDRNDTSAFGYGARNAGVMNVTSAEVVYQTNVTNLNPRSFNELWIVAESSTGETRSHVALVSFRTKKTPPGFRNFTFADGVSRSTPWIHVGAVSASVSAVLDAPGIAYLIVQRADVPRLTSSRVKQKALANETGACSVAACACPDDGRLDDALP